MDSATTFNAWGTEWPYAPPRSMSRRDELHGFWLQCSSEPTAILRAAAALVLGCSPAGRALGLALDDATPIGVYATAAMDRIHGSNAAAKARGAEAERPYLSGKELVAAAMVLAPRLAQDLPILEWEVSEAVGNSVAALPS